MSEQEQGGDVPIGELTPPEDQELTRVELEEVALPEYEWPQPLPEWGQDPNAGAEEDHIYQEGEPTSDSHHVGEED